MHVHANVYTRVAACCSVLQYAAVCIRPMHVRADVYTLGQAWEGRRERATDSFISHTNDKLELKMKQAHLWFLSPQCVAVCCSVLYCVAMCC